MTIPYERTETVRRTRRLLQQLTDPRLTPRVPRAIRDEAITLLRHYPDDMDLYWTAEALPARWAKPGERF